jgi:hypothetical protein
MLLHEWSGRSDLKILVLAAIAGAVVQAEAQPVGLVTPDNFVRAETDLYFSSVIKDAGGVGKFVHRRVPTPVDQQLVIRMNRDTLSGAVFDLDAGPITVTLANAGKRFMSMQVITEDEYTPEAIYSEGPHILDKTQVSTRHVLVAVRTLVDPEDPKDVDQVHALQDAIQVSQQSTGTFYVPSWGQASQKKVRDALLVLASSLPDTNRMFGTRAQVDPVRHLIGAASAWGGNPDKEASYLNVTPAKNDGTTVYGLTVWCQCGSVVVTAKSRITVHGPRFWMEKGLFPNRNRSAADLRF